MKFSDRYGYTNPQDTLIRETISVDLINCICTCYDDLNSDLTDLDRTDYGPLSLHSTYAEMEQCVWCFYLNKRKADFWNNRGIHCIVVTEYLKSNYQWFEKLNLIEFTIKKMRNLFKEDHRRNAILDDFLHALNATFKRLMFSYRVVGDELVEISAEEEIVEIEESIKQGDTIKAHISDALLLLSKRPTPDYRNSIKESISAVEAECRLITGENTLGKALNRLEDNGIVIPSMLKTAFEKLYVYTNDESTGIRHALMDGKEAPGFEEAKFMLVACSAFVNYLKTKQA